MNGYRKGVFLEAGKEHGQENNHKGLFVADLDGTLLTDQKVIAKVDLEALQRLRNLGFLTAIATGRSNYSFNKLMDLLGYSGSANTLPVDYIIFSTGAGIMDFPESRILKSFALGKEEVRYIADYLETLGLDYMIHKPVPDTRHFLYSAHGKDNPDFHARLKIYNDFAAPLTPDSLAHFGEATEVLCIASQDKGHEYAARIAKTLKQFSVIKATSPLDGKSVWIELFAPNVSKSQATRLLAERVGVDRKNICAVGNDFNDEDLLEWAGQGFVVSNGPQSIKSRFEVVASNNEGGVSEAVNRWLLTTYP